MDNLTIDSGDNGQSRCLTSVLYMQKSFVGANSKVSFNYRVEGRACVSSFLGCDGLSFLVDDIQVLDHIGSSFQWKTFTTNLTAVSPIVRSWISKIQGEPSWDWCWDPDVTLYAKVCISIAQLVTFHIYVSKKGCLHKFSTPFLSRNLIPSLTLCACVEMSETQTYVPLLLFRIQ